MNGTFYGIGVGPGDSELLTVKAVRLIERCGVLAVPFSETDSTALSIAKPYIGKEKEIVKLHFPMTYDKNTLEDKWDAAAKETIRYLSEGKDVAFLTLGDAMFYSTYIYLLQRIKEAGFHTETVPGVTAFSAAYAKIGRAAAKGKERFVVVPSSYGQEDLVQLLQAFDNVVLMKVSKDFPELVQKIEVAGRLKDAVLVSKLGLEGETITSHIKEVETVPYLSIVLICKE